MESFKEADCQASDGPILCINNCGFFGSATTMNMCSKCHKDMMSKQQQTKTEALHMENIVHGSTTSTEKELVYDNAVHVGAVEPSFGSPQPPTDSASSQTGPNRCATCHKRVGLTGFRCRCDNLFCSVHRYSDKHECLFDYRTAGRDAIVKANPLVKAEKLDKI